MAFRNGSLYGTLLVGGGLPIEKHMWAVYGTICTYEKTDSSRCLRGRDGNRLVLDTKAETLRLAVLAFTTPKACALAPEMYARTNGILL